MLNTIIDLDAVASLVRAQGFSAYVEQTGGGIATLYAGPLAEDVSAMQHVAAAGPGYFRTGAPLADLGSLYIGPDGTEEVTDLTEPANVGAFRETQIAALVAAQVRAGSGRGLSSDEVEHLGLDGTGRSRPQELIDADEESRVYCDAHNARLAQVRGHVDNLDSALKQAEAAGRAAVKRLKLKRRTRPAALERWFDVAVTVTEEQTHRVTVSAADEDAARERVLDLLTEADVTDLHGHDGPIGGRTWVSDEVSAVVPHGYAF